MCLGSVQVCASESGTVGEVTIESLAATECSCKGSAPAATTAAPVASLSCAHARARTILLILGFVLEEKAQIKETNDIRWSNYTAYVLGLIDDLVSLRKTGAGEIEHRDLLDAAYLAAICKIAQRIRTSTDYPDFSFADNFADVIRQEAPFGDTLVGIQNDLIAMDRGVGVVTIESLAKISCSGSCPTECEHSRAKYIQRLLGLACEGRAEVADDAHARWKSQKAYLLILIEELASLRAPTDSKIAHHKLLDAAYLTTACKIAQEIPTNLRKFPQTQIILISLLQQNLPM